jgi:homoserine dehydrogenase
VSRRARPLRVALAGCGTVGGALLDVLRSGVPAGGRPVEVVRVLARGAVGRARPKAVAGLPSGCLTTDIHAFLRTPADVVVEAIGGCSPAAEIAEHVLSRGGHFLTANKTLVAARGAQLAALAGAAGGTFSYDAAVGGGVPVIRVLRSSTGARPVRSIRGIHNGTAKFVQTRHEAGDPLHAALAMATARGLAEADASRDLDGRDVADKLAVLAWVAWGVAPESVTVRREGLLPDPEVLVRQAVAAGGRLRLVGECRFEDGAVQATVRPEVVAPDSTFGRTLGEENRVAITVGWSTPIELAGPGAGGAPTAASLWGDLCQVAEVA